MNQVIQRNRCLCGTDSSTAMTPDRLTRVVFAPAHLIEPKTIIRVLVALAIGAVVAVPTPAVHAAPEWPIVGRWARVNTCAELVSALQKAGLRALAPSILEGSDMVRGSAQELARKRNICQGAVPAHHSHFFTLQGQFGSLDGYGQQVDGGSYRVIDDHTIHIGAPGGTFHYRIVAGNRLLLQPVIPVMLKRQALAHPLQGSAVGWMMAVAYPGYTWQRVPCNGWC